MKLKSFKNFNTDAIFEANDITDLQYVQIDGINNEDELVAFIEKHSTAAFKDMCQRNNIPIPNPKIAVDKNKASLYLRLYCDPVDPNDFGIFKNVMEKVSFAFFSGREVKHMTDDNGKFVVNPIVWTTLNLSWEMIKGGSNGGDYLYDKDFHIEAYAKRSDIFYNIVAKKWETFVEHHAEKIGALVSKKLHDASNKHGVFD